MSTRTASWPRAFAARRPSVRTAAGSAPSAPRWKELSARSAQTASCSAAAARKVSAAQSRTLRPSSFQARASLPMVVPWLRTEGRGRAGPVERAEDLVPQGSAQGGDPAPRERAAPQPLHGLLHRGQAEVRLQEGLLQRLEGRRIQGPPSAQDVPHRGFQHFPGAGQAPA